jgi:hypothetical protein
MTAADLTEAATPGDAEPAAEDDGELDADLNSFLRDLKKKR